MQRVIEKHAANSLSLNNSQLIIEPLYPVADSVGAADGTAGEEVDQVIVYELPMSVCTDDITVYFSKADVKVSKVVYSCQPGVAIVKFCSAFGEWSWRMDGFV